MIYGFSTGALALGDFERGLAICREFSLEAVELSALRESELPNLVQSLDSIDLHDFTAVSLHAPSSLRDMTETHLVELLDRVTKLNMSIVVHPNVISNIALWRRFGRWLCIENMDKRKPIGRTAAELRPILSELPEAKLCVDLGHARQVDPSMAVAAEILTEFNDRVTHLHISDVNSSSHHEPLSRAAIHAFQQVAALVPPSVVVILESTFCTANPCVELEIEAAKDIFSAVQQLVVAS
jgi:hypothetical protein